MNKSTKSETLDKNTVGFALKNWTGPPHAKAEVPIAYMLPKRQAPPEGMRTHAVGAGRCEVVLDATGHAASARMTKSTGSKDLDENTLVWARKSYVGPPNTTRVIPIIYMDAPRPPYPYQARAGGLQGSGICKIVLNASGHVATADMVKSTGSSILDENTEKFARANWTGGANTMVFIPVTYRIMR